jgi:hypothetical protein
MGKQTSTCASGECTIFTLQIMGYYGPVNCITGRSQWLVGLRCRSAAASLLRLWVRILPGTWMSVCCECCVLSGTGFFSAGGMITRPEESYQLLCVVVCDLETSRMRRSWPALGRCATGEKICIMKHTNSIEQSPSWEANGSSAGQEIPRRFITVFTGACHLIQINNGTCIGRKIHEERLSFDESIILSYILAK